MRLCLNMLIFTHNLGNWLIPSLLLQSTNSSQYRDERKMPKRHNSVCYDTVMTTPWLHERTSTQRPAQHNTAVMSAIHHLWHNSHTNMHTVQDVTHSSPLSIFQWYNDSYCMDSDTAIKPDIIQRSDERSARQWLSLKLSHVISDVCGQTSNSGDCRDPS